MIRLNCYFSNWSSSGAIIHALRVELKLAFSGDYRPSKSFGELIPYKKFPDHIEPIRKLQNTQYAKSLDGHLSSKDISSYAARMYIKQMSCSILRNDQHAGLRRQCFHR